MPRSPLAPASFPALPVVAGVRFATAAAGIKYKDRADVMLAALDAGTVVAGTFTRSSTRSAAVLDCQAKLGADATAPAAVLVNSGNSNAFTGAAGAQSVDRLCAAVAEGLGVPPTRVFTSSTGVIGEPLPDRRIIATLADLTAHLSPTGLSAAAKAIMTTDTFAKGASRQVDIAGKTVTIAGIAKGSGMIAPDMATMLVYIFTDAVVDYPTLQAMTRTACDQTFNCITVDSDTSTSDTVLVCATQASGVDVTGHGGFAAALHDVMRDLAHQVVKDGEGASKFIEVSVSGATDDADARKVALSIANSPLVKTAIAGEDPNWGRIVMAIGKSGAVADRDLISIYFGDLRVACNGWVDPNYREADGVAHMQGQNINIRVDMGLGGGAATVWTCDLTHDYITINADYRS